jgi:bacillopeptidase F
MKTNGFLLLFLWVFLLFPEPILSAELTPELTEKLQTLDPEEELPVILRLVDPADLTSLPPSSKSQRRVRVAKLLRERGEASEKPVRAFLVGHTPRKIQSLWIINGLALTAPVRVIRLLAALPQVQSLRLDQVITRERTPGMTAGTPEWHLNTIRAPLLWDLGFTGQGVVAANMDTGVDAQHPDLAGRWRGGINSWYDPNNEHFSPFDADGHGTQTMGLIVGGDAGGTAIGVAPGARWIAAKVFNDAGDAFLSNIHLGFQWLLDPDRNPSTPDAPDVVSSSWGFDNPASLINTCGLEFADDIQALRQAGIAVVFSSGNKGPSPATSLYPANNPGALAVGYTSSSDMIAAESSRGPSACGGTIYPQLVAPGQGILVADLTLNGTNLNPYAFGSGSSFSAPQVAGVLALLLSAFPEASVETLEQALKNSARDLGLDGPDNTYGYGLVDAFRAYQNFFSLKIYLPLILH